MLAMDNEKLKLPEEIYYGNLETICNIKFTPREIDVIAFLISGRSIKKIASFFKIAPKTVENHNRNIMQKLGCNSRESIIDFIERSPKFQIIKKYYISLLVQATFEQILKDISGSEHNEIIYVVKHCPSNKLKDALINQLGKHLTLAGMKTRIEANRDSDCFTNQIDNINSHTIYTNDSVNLLKEVENISELDIFDFQNYYNSIFMLLKKFLPHVEFELAIDKFRKQAGTLQLSKDFYPNQSGEENLQNKSYLEKLINFVSFLNFKKRKLLLVGGIVNLGVIIGLICFYKNYESNQPFLLSNTPKEPYTASVHSDLIIPNEKILLDRTGLLKRIDEKLARQHGIKYVALIGMGGVGKTTISRQYARSQKSPVIWEINAETHETLINSLENLTDLLAKTPEEKQELKEVLQVQEQTKRELKLQFFLKKILFKHPGWLLIYDNVESFSEIQSFFPLDSKAWGEGKIIITSRDSNIGNNNQFKTNQIVEIEALNETEQNVIFENIYNPDDNSHTTIEQKQKIRKFLKNIPPFPLDTSIAANYLKNSKISFDGYIRLLESLDSLRDDTLKTISGHQKTRHGIITASLKLLLAEFPEFKDLLLLISLIDSQNIPRDLLLNYKTQALIDQFLYHLKKHSLLIQGSLKTNESVPIFSIHHSTQEVIFSYLTKSLNLNKEHPGLKSISSFLCDYMEDLRQKDDVLKMKYLTNHIETLLKHSELLSETARADLRSRLAFMYVYLGAYQKSQLHFDKSLSFCSKYYGQNHIKTAEVKQGLGYLYRGLGEYEKSKNVLENALSILVRHYGYNNSKTVDAILYLGNAYRSVRDYKKSKELLEQGLIFYEKKDGNNHINVAWILVHLGHTYHRLGEYTKALNALEKALTIYNTHYDSENVYCAFPLIRLGSVYGKIGFYEKGLKGLHQALKIYKNYYGNKHVETAIILINLGTIYQRLGDYAEALKYFREGYDVYKDHFGDGHIEACWSAIHLGNIYRLVGDYARAKLLIETNVKVYVEKYGKNHPSTGWTQLNLANVYKDLNDSVKAKLLYEEVLEVYTRHFGKDHFNVAQILSNLGEVYLSEGRLEEANTFLSSALAINQRTQNPECCFTLESLAKLHTINASEAAKNNKPEDAKRSRKTALIFLEQAHKILENNFPKTSPHFQRIQIKIRDLT